MLVKRPRNLLANFHRPFQVRLGVCRVLRMFCGYLKLLGKFSFGLVELGDAVNTGERATFLGIYPFLSRFIIIVDFLNAVFERLKFFPIPFVAFSLFLFFCVNGLLPEKKDTDQCQGNGNCGQDEIQGFHVYSPINFTIKYAKPMATPKQPGQKYQSGGGFRVASDSLKSFQNFPMDGIVPHFAEA